MSPPWQRQPASLAASSSPIRTTRAISPPSVSRMVSTACPSPTHSTKLSWQPSGVKRMLSTGPTGLSLTVDELSRTTGRISPGSPGATGCFSPGSPGPSSPGSPGKAPRPIRAALCVSSYSVPAGLQAYPSKAVSETKGAGAHTYVIPGQSKSKPIRRFLPVNLPLNTDSKVELARSAREDLMSSRREQTGTRPKVVLPMDSPVMSRSLSPKASNMREDLMSSRREQTGTRPKVALPIDSPVMSRSLSPHASNTREDLMSSRREQTGTRSKVVSSPKVASSPQAGSIKFRSPRHSNGIPPLVARSRSPSPDFLSASMCQSSRTSVGSLLGPLPSPPPSLFGSLSSPPPSTRRQEARVVGITKGVKFTLGSPPPVCSGSLKVRQEATKLYNGEVSMLQEPTEMITPEKSAGTQRHSARAVPAKEKPAPIAWPGVQAAEALVAAPTPPNEPCESTVAAQEGVKVDVSGKETVLNAKTDVFTPASPENSKNGQDGAAVVAEDAASIAQDNTEKVEDKRPSMPNVEPLDDYESPQARQNKVKIETPQTGYFIPPTPFVDEEDDDRRLVTPLTRKTCRKKTLQRSLQPHVYAACQSITEALDDRTKLNGGALLQRSSGDLQRSGQHQRDVRGTNDRTAKMGKDGL